MKGLPRKGHECLLRVLGQERHLGHEARAISGVAQQRMTYGGEVDPDLMGASGLEPAVEQTRNRRGGTAALRTCRMHVMPPPDPPAPHPTLPRKQGRVSRYTLPCLRGRVGWGQREGDRRIVFQYLPQRYG